MPTVSVILINYNSTHHTINCVNSIREQTNNELEYEIIVVDNNSREEEKLKLTNWLSQPEQSDVIFYQSERNTGFTGGNMIGVNLAHGKYLYLLNNDCILQNDVLAILSQFMNENLKVAAVDDIYREFIEQLVKKAESRLSNKEMNETEDSEGQENWEQAIKDYEEALDLYSSYTVSDPFAPAYNGANVYEDQFVEARRQLGRLYKARADRLRNNGKVEKAIHNYKEAIKLLPKTDRLFQEAFLEMKKLRIQVNVPEEK